MTTKTPYITGHCGIDNHLNCRGSYADTACGCICHVPVEAPSTVATSDVDLGEALTLLNDSVLMLDQALPQFDGNDIEWCDLLGRIRTDRMRLADLESLVERQAARAMTGKVLEWPGGVAERHHGKDRKQWDHDAMNRAVAAAVIQPLTVNVETGAVDTELAALLHLAVEQYAATHRPEWRVTAVKPLGIDPDEFCTAVPGRTTVQVTLGKRDEAAA